MKTQKVLAFIALLMVLAGFCLPWIEFYGYQSGIDGIRTALMVLTSSRPISPMSLFLLFSLIPLMAIICTWIVSNTLKSRLRPILYLLILDLTALFAWYSAASFTYYKNIFAWFYLMIFGIIILNVQVISKYFIKEKALITPQ